MEIKLITVMGSQIGKEERATLHTATCECGCRIVRAKKESSLKFYIGNEKYRAKCCGSKLTYTGEKEFIGENLVPEKIKNEGENKMERVSKIVKVELLEDVKDIISAGPRGVTNQNMIPAIKANKENMDNLRRLYIAYPEIFKSAAKYCSDKIKLNCNKVIIENENEFRLYMGKRALNKLEAPKTEIITQEAV